MKHKVFKLSKTKIYKMSNSKSHELDNGVVVTEGDEFELQEKSAQLAHEAGDVFRVHNICGDPGGLRMDLSSK